MWFHLISDCSWMGSRSVERSTEALCAAFEGLSQDKLFSDGKWQREGTICEHFDLAVVQERTWLRRMGEKLPQPSLRLAWSKKTWERQRLQFLCWIFESLKRSIDSTVCPCIYVHRVFHSLQQTGRNWELDDRETKNDNFGCEIWRLEAAEELMRLTVVFLLNSFASSDNEVRLCMVCKQVFAKIENSCRFKLRLLSFYRPFKRSLWTKRECLKTLRDSCFFVVWQALSFLCSLQPLLQLSSFLWTPTLLDL